MSWFHTHAHSEYSCLDGMVKVDDMVAKAASLDQPGLALTDHGFMSGSFELYKACQVHDIRPFPGLEAYVVTDLAKEASRYHLTFLATSTKGYQSLVKLCTLSHRRDHFHFKPRVSLEDLGAMAADGATEGIAVLTGCFFGLVQQALVHQGPEVARRLVTMLAGWFPDTFVEVQHHHTDHDGVDDNELVSQLVTIAHDLSLPLIATQDCHYLDRSHRDLHTLMKSVAYGGDPGDVGFPGDSYHLASTDWVRTHYLGHTGVWERALEGSQHLLDLHSLTIPVLDRYTYVVPGDPDQALSLGELCWQELLDRQLGPDYAERLRYELKVIEGLGMADYFLLVRDYVQHAEEQNILVMARGSAAGSLVCWLLGFTQVDPLKWSLTFDRFLTPDRIRPPDIDLDVEDSRRAEIVEYLAGKYQLTQIGTFGRVGFDEDSGRGSVFVKYMAGQRKHLGDAFQESPLAKCSNLNDLGQIQPREARMLMDLARHPLRSSPSAHAAGFVLSVDELKLDDWIPTMLIASSDTMVTQMVMDDVEDCGFVKIDLLGLRSLSTMAACLELIGKAGTDWIPLDDSDTMKFLRKGKPGTGIFQLEGYTAAKGCRELKPRTVRDLILLNALYRPATMDHGYTEAYLRNRADPSQVSYPGAVFKKHLAETFGVPVFQEQVLAILRDLGMPVDKLNDFLTAVKGKHAVGGYSDKSGALVAGARADFDRLCIEAGMTTDEADEGWSLVEGFAAYGFNRAHATAYSLLGYQLAYLKVHHPLEFHTALLATTPKKQTEYVSETRRCDIRILPADVNVSGSNWTLDRANGAIRRGLSSIKGIGDRAAAAIAESAPFDSMEDLIERTPARLVTGGKDYHKGGALIGVLAKLREANALRSLDVLPTGEG